MSAFSVCTAPAPPIRASRSLGAGPGRCWNLGVEEQEAGGDIVAGWTVCNRQLETVDVVQKMVIHSQVLRTPTNCRSKFQLEYTGSFGLRLID